MLAAIVSVLFLVTFFKKSLKYFFFLIIIFVDCNLIKFLLLSYIVCVCTLCVCNAERFFVMSFFLSLSLTSSHLCFYVLLIFCLSYHNCTEYKNNSVLPFINIRMRVIDWCLNGHNPLPSMLLPDFTLYSHFLC